MFRIDSFRNVFHNCNNIFLFVELENMATSDLEYLLLQGQKLCKDTDNFKPVSKIHKSLRQLCRNADRAPKQSIGASDEQCAKEFLANRGLDLSNYSNVLNKLSTHRDNVVIPCDSKPVMDYSSSVESLMGKHIEDYINNLEASDKKEADDRYLCDLPTSWKTIKKCVVYNEFASDSYDVSFCLQNLLATKTAYFTFDPNKKMKKMKNDPDESNNFPFVADVQDYIKAKDNGGSDKELIEYFLETVHNSNAEPTVTHIWNVVKYMCNIAPQESPHGSFGERFSEENQSKLVKNAKTYLEDKFKAFLIKETRRLDIRDDGNYMAAVINAYVFMNAGRSAIQLNDFHVDEQSIWPLLYFSLRCGQLDVANYFVQKSGMALDDLVSVFVHLKEADFAERGASSVGATLNKYYRTLPVYDNAFRKTIFSLLGMVEANMEKKAVSKTIEDHLWMLLTEHFASKYMEDSNGLDYCSIQRYVLDRGEPYKEQPCVYFELLFLIGQFECAINFLYRNAKFSNHAVHVAVGLHEKRLLATPEHVQAPFLSNENVDVKFVRLNYARLILLFCNEFETNCPHYAIYYYYLLKNIKCPTLADDLFYTCVADLATSFDENMCDWMFGCFGDANARGVLRDTFAADTVKSIVDRTLELSSEKNKPEVAYKLYSLTSSKAAYGVLNDMLSCAIYDFDVSSGRRAADGDAANRNFRDRVRAYAEELNGRKTTALETVGGPVSAFRVLRDVYAFFYHASRSRFVAAVDSAVDTGLVPFAVEDTQRCANNCTGHGEIVQRIVHHFIKSLVLVLCAEHCRIVRCQSGGATDGDHDDDSLIEEENSDMFDQTRDVGWTKRRIRKTVRLIYLFAAQLPVHVAQDAVEYISANALNIQLD